MKKWILISTGLVAGFLFACWLIQQNPRPAISIHHLLSDEEPPFWLQRLEQRQEVIARVQAAGGWDSLKGDCFRLLQTNKNSGYFIWHRGLTNEPALPPAIAALQPMSVEAYSPGVVSISLYGMGEGRHRGIANYGLEVDCGTPINQDEPRHYPARTYRKIRDGIYENY